MTQHLAAAVAAALLMMGGTSLDAGGQARVPPGPRPSPSASGRIRQLAPNDPSYERSIATLRFEARQSLEAVPSPARGRRTGGALWWPWRLAPQAFAAGQDSAVYAIPPDAGPLGGLQLDVQPWRAEVYVDGVYEGRVEDFRGYYEHLALGPGLHVVALVADDREPLVLEVLVSPGQTLTYRGTLAYLPR